MSDVAGGFGDPQVLVESAFQGAFQDAHRPVVDGMAVRLVEAALFASSDPVSERALFDLLQAQQALPSNGGPESEEDVSAFLRAVLDAVCAVYAERGVRPVQVAGGWQFRTAPDLAPALTKVTHRPKRLARSAMETLSIVAYHQPCTRAEIEEIRGVSLSQATLDSLLEASLIVPKGRKEVPGRPVLWGTSADFLRHFGLRDLRDLPRREELMVELPNLGPANRDTALEPDPAPAVPDEGVAC